RTIHLTWDARYLWLALLIVVLGWLTVVPVIRLVIGSLTDLQTGEYTLANYARVYSSPSTWDLLFNSVAFALGSCVVAFVIGTTLAWIIERTDTPFRRIFYTVAIIPIIVPGIVTTIAWLFLLSPQIGWINSMARAAFGLEGPLFNVYTLPGMMWVEGLGASPLVFLLMSAALKSMDPSLEESASVNGANWFVTLRRVTLPLMLPTIISVMLIVFVRVLEGFEVPAIIGLPGRIQVLTSKIYVALSKTPKDEGTAGALATLFIVLSIAGILLYRHLTRRAERFATVGGKAYRPRQIQLGKLKYVTLAILLAYTIVIIILPLTIMLWMSFQPFITPPTVDGLARLTLRNYQRMLTFPNVVDATRNSLFLAIGAAAISTLFAAVVAWVSIRSKLAGKAIVDVLAFLPIAIPGIVMGAALVAMYISFPIPIYGTIWVLLVAYATRFFPYGMRSASSSLLQLRRELEEAAEVAGANWLTRFRFIVLPLLRPGLLAGGIYILIVAIRELSSSALLASPKAPVLAVLILEFQEAGNYAAVAALSVLLVVALAALVTVLQIVGGKIGVQTH
ncbi:MAG TPA: iron ABC transporter permease, partial [Chloroflexota bacterium]|nr:iron ABC transporter permease [Chloroflexota bacterium]